MKEQQAKVISYERIKEVIESIPELRVRAMVAAQYGLAARAGELIQYRHTDGKETIGLLRENIQFLNGVWVCNMPNFKNAKQGFKKPFISPRETFVFEPFQAWLKRGGRQVFPLHISRFRSLVKKVLPDGLASHALRHSRATHLAEIFGFNAYEIKAFLGHARLDTSAIYVSQDLSRSAGKMEAML